MKKLTQSWKIILLSEIYFFQNCGTTNEFWRLENCSQRLKSSFYLLTFLIVLLGVLFKDLHNSASSHCFAANLPDRNKKSVESITRIMYRNITLLMSKQSTINRLLCDNVYSNNRSTTFYTKPPDLILFPTFISNVSPEQSKLILYPLINIIYRT